MAITSLQGTFVRTAWTFRAHCSTSLSLSLSILYFWYRFLVFYILSCFTQSSNLYMHSVNDTKRNYPVKCRIWFLIMSRRDLIVFVGQANSGRESLLYRLLFCTSHSKDLLWVFYIYLIELYQCGPQHHSPNLFLWSEIHNIHHKVSVSSSIPIQLPKRL